MVRAHDIGAGGAGLRTAIEASAAGASVGLGCKSLLGKAHTVMAEVGIAAAMGTVDERDDWRVHFADTMRGGDRASRCQVHMASRQSDRLARVPAVREALRAGADSSFLRSFLFALIK